MLQFIIKLWWRGGIAKADLQTQLIEVLHGRGLFSEAEKITPEVLTTPTRSSLDWKRLAMRDKELEWEQTKQKEQREHELK